MSTTEHKGRGQRLGQVMSHTNICVSIGLLLCCAALNGCIGPSSSRDSAESASSQPRTRIHLPSDDTTAPEKPKREALELTEIVAPSIRIALVDQTDRSFRSGDMVGITYESSSTSFPQRVQVVASLMGKDKQFSNPSMIEITYEVVSTNITANSGQFEVGVQELTETLLSTMEFLGQTPLGIGTVSVALFEIDSVSEQVGVQLSNIMRIKVEL